MHDVVLKVKWYNILTVGLYDNKVKVYKANLKSLIWLILHLRWVSKPKAFKGMYEAKMEFPEEWGEVSGYFLK